MSVPQIAQGPGLVLALANFSKFTPISWAEASTATPKQSRMASLALSITLSVAALRLNLTVKSASFCESF